MTIRLTEITQHIYDPAKEEICVGVLCESCSGPLTVGEYEATGLCNKCYWDLQELSYNEE
jgi:uncharacterized CHY-type Zn-finger protein